jgi:TolA-binding protein
MIPSAVMTQTQPAPSVHNSASENADPADNPVVARLQQAVNLANENCDRATALAHTLSAQLRDAQSRINQLELEADRLVEALRAGAETAIAKLQHQRSRRANEARFGGANRSNGGRRRESCPSIAGRARTGKAAY